MSLHIEQAKLENVERQLETAKIEVEKPFAQEAELAEKLERLAALNALLNMDEISEKPENAADAPMTYPGEKLRSLRRGYRSGKNWICSRRRQPGRRNRRK